MKNFFLFVAIFFYTQSANAQFPEPTGLTLSTTDIPPAIDQPKDVSVCEGAKLQDILLTGISTGGEFQTLTIEAASNNTIVVPNPIVTYKNPDTDGYLSYTPVKGASGVAIITITVRDGGSASNTVVKTFKITVNPKPVSVGVISGTATVCQGQSLVGYSVSSIDHITNYNWVLPAGAKISSGDNTNSVTVNYSTAALSGSIYVYGKNACGSGAYSPAFPVDVHPLPAAAGTISGTATVCQGQNGIVYSVPEMLNASGYVWTVPPGAAIVSGTNTNSIAVNYSGLATSGHVKVKGTNDCGDGIISEAFTVAVNSLPAAAGVIMGTAAVCEAMTGVKYSVPVIANATGYTWTLPSGVDITSGDNTNEIIVKITAGASAGNITVKGINDCGAGTVSTAFSITVGKLPIAAGTITGTATICQGTNGIAFSLPSVLYASGYTWTVPSGVSIASGANTNSIMVNFSDNASSGNITAEGTNTCGSGTASAAYPVQIDVATKANAGPDQIICSGIATLAGNTPVAGTAAWTKISGSCSINEVDDPNTNVAGIAVPSTIKLKWTISNGICAASADTVSITSQACPIGADFTVSSSVRCINTGSITFTDQSSGATSHAWDFGDGATPATANTVGPHIVSYATSGPKTISLTVSGPGGSNTKTKTNFVTINSLPDAAATISGMATVCQGETVVNYSVPAIGNATGYTWSLPPGAIVNTGAGNNAITVNYAASAVSGNITVKGINTCGEGSVSVNYHVTVNSLPDAADALTGSATVCQKEKGVLYSVGEIPYATGYNWILLAGSIVAGNNTESITVDYFADASSGNIKVRGTNACGAGIMSPVFPLTVNPLPEDAGVITGTATVCAGQKGVSYSVPVIAGALKYAWMVPEGATIVSGDSTNTIVVDYGAAAVSGNVVVKGMNACGSGTLSTIFAVTVNPLPLGATAISGKPAVCQGEDLVTFSVSAITNALTHNWILPAGATLASGEHSNSIQVDFSDSAVSGNIVVFGNNTCGSGASSNYAVMVNPLPELTSGIIGSPTVCQGQVGVIYKVPPVANATTYLWSLPVGATLVAGDTKDSITVNYSSGALSGNITVMGGNACGNGKLSADFFVTVNQLPDGAGPVSGSSTLSMCMAQDKVIYKAGAINNATGYSWTLPIGGSVISGNNTDAVTVRYAAHAVSGTVNVKGENTCGSGTVSPGFSVTIASVPVLPICYVTVDTSSTYNQVAWEKPSASDIDSFRVYRETTNGYEVIRYLPYNASGMITDSASKPNTTFSRYKLSVIDSCGNESELSEYHSTIYLAANIGVAGVVNLNWSKYEGSAVNYYRILRDDIGNGKFHVIDSVTQSNDVYTDQEAASYPDGRYKIEVVWSGNCGAANKTTATINTTRSNIKNTNKMIASVPAGNTDDKIKLYPNPVNDHFLVEYPGRENPVVSLYNSLGQLVFSEKTTVADNPVKNTKRVDVTGFVRGVYVLKIVSEKTYFFKKVVIE